MPKFKPEVSKKNENYISKHRFYELKHFCLQYDEWKKELNSLDIIFSSQKLDPNKIYDKHHQSDPTYELACKRIRYYELINMVDRCCIQTSKEYWGYIFKGVTKGLPYDCLVTVHGLDCSRDKYYEMYRRFFWLLSNARD